MVVENRLMSGGSSGEDGNNRSINGPRRPITVDYGGDEVQIFSRQSFLDHRINLIATTAEFMHKQLGWTMEVAEKTIAKGLAVTTEDITNESGIPSVILFKRGEEYIGVSAQRCIKIYTAKEGNVPFLQHLLRAIKPKYRGKHRGRFVLQQARVIHPDALYYGHRTQNPVTAYANLQSGIFEPGTYSPWEERYDADPLKQEIMVGYFMRARVNGKSIDWSTGVSKDDFPEVNMSYLPRLDHAPTMEMFRRMEQEFGMVFPGRDALHGIGKLR